MKARFEIFILRIACRFDHPLAIGRTALVNILGERFPLAVRAGTCETPALDCRSCAQAGRCAYAVLFVPPPDDEVAGIPYIDDTAAPFAIRPPDRGPAKAAFDVVLVGDAIAHAPEVVAAFAVMGRMGLGRERVRFTTGSCAALDQSFAPRSGEVPPSAVRTLLDCGALGPGDLVGRGPVAAVKRAAVRFVTPPLLRPGRSDVHPGFTLLVRRLRDRARVVGTLHCGGAPDMNLKGLAVNADDVSTLRDDPAHPCDSVLYAGPLGEFMPLLRLGSYLNVGEQCGFGQGWYELPA